MRIGLTSQIVCIQSQGKTLVQVSVLWRVLNSLWLSHFFQQCHQPTICRRTAAPGWKKALCHTSLQYRDSRVGILGLRPELASLCEFSKHGGGNSTAHKRKLGCLGDTFWMCSRTGKVPNQVCPRKLPGTGTAAGPCNLKLNVYQGVHALM